MYKIHFYRDEKGREPVAEYMDLLAKKNDKNSRIKLNKIRDYIKLLSFKGLALREPFVKHIDGEIWELRPIRDRIFFAVWYNDSFIILHHFMKKTQKTPKKEIEQAKRNLQDLLDRGVTYE